MQNQYEDDEEEDFGPSKSEIKRRLDTLQHLGGARGVAHAADRPADRHRIPALRRGYRVPGATRLRGRRPGAGVDRPRHLAAGAAGDRIALCVHRQQLLFQLRSQRPGARRGPVQCGCAPHPGVDQRGDAACRNAVAMDIRQSGQPAFPVGKRNVTLFAVGCKLKLGEVDNWPELVRARAEAVGLDDTEIDKLIENIEKYAVA